MNMTQMNRTGKPSSPAGSFGGLTLSHARCLWVLSLLMVALCFGQAHADTTVSGPVSGTWTQTDSPYLVTGGLLVLPGNSLIIQPNVQVRFQGPYVFEVDGILQASGASNNPIVFTRANPAIAWNGIFFNGSSGSSLTYCQVYGSTNSGIRITNGTAVLRDCVIANNSSRTSGGGVDASGGSGTLVLDKCVVTNNMLLRNPTTGGGGIALGGGNAEISRCLIAGNSTGTQPSYPGGGGILCYSGIATIDNAMITNNACSAGYGGGVSVYGSHTEVRNCVVANNTCPAGGRVFLITEPGGWQTS